MTSLVSRITNTTHVHLTVAGALLLALCVAAPAEDAADLTPVHHKQIEPHPAFILAEKGTSRVSICVMTAAPSRKLQQIVAELQTSVELTTGAKLPIVNGAIVEPAIVIGDCAEAAKLGLVGKTLPIEGYELKTTANAVYIVGNDELVDEATSTGSDGTAWGVTDLCERFVGVRWYWPVDMDGRSIQPQSSIVIPASWYADAPAFRYRFYWDHIPNRDPRIRDFLRQGTSWPMEIRVHQPDEWAYNEDFFTNRPEIFQMNPGGSRDHSMYCYSNPRTLATFMEDIDAHYSGAKPASFIHGDTITVSPRDLGVACVCPDCSKLMDPAAGNLGSASRIMTDFITKLATAVEAKHPGKSIMFLAYMNYTRAPAGVKLPKNVFVQVCGMNGIATYKEPEMLAADQAPIDDWIAATGNKVKEWQYSCWPADRTQAPYQYLHVLQDFYRSNRDKSVGCFINSLVADEWERFHITFHAWMKLLWNPDFPVDAAVETYCTRMYGPAADSVREIVHLQADGWEKSRWPNGRLTPKAIYELSFPKATLERIRALLTKAKTEAAPDALATTRLAYFSSIFERGFEEYATVMEGAGVQPMTAFKVAQTPIIDGLLDDAAWQTAESVLFAKFDEFGSKQQIACVHHTEAKAVFTLDGITFGFRMSEPHPDKLVRKITTNDNGLTYWDDCIELFLDSTGKNEGLFVQAIINANGAIQVIDNGGGPLKAEHVKTKSALGDGFWSMEVYVPYTSLAPGARGGTGTKWTIQLTRNRMSDAGVVPDSLRENQKLNARFGGFNSNAADFTTLNFRE